MNPAKTQIQPYLFFDGRCDEAVEFYRRAVGAEVLGLMTRFLEGIRVIDAANFIAGPVSTTMMADFGADVIKVEPPTGDVYRVRGAGYPPSAYNYPWIVDNRSKRSVAIDLRTEDGQRVLHRLVADVDVFVTNAPLDSRARLRVRYEDLAPLNPRLVYASISAYGEHGDEASKPGFDSIALWARTGLMLVATYFWSGVSKLNPDFGPSVLPWAVAPLGPAGALPPAWLAPLGMEAHKGFNNLTAAKEKVDHVDVYFNAGHPGVAEPHYHVVVWYVSPDKAASLK